MDGPVQHPRHQQQQAHEVDQRVTVEPLLQS
jgi:hypothetical protein